VASSSVADFKEIGRRDLAVQPGLDILTCRRNEPGKQRVVACRKGGLPGLQPRLNVGERRKIPEGHRVSPF
jgi:hypothetical protein